MGVADLTDSPARTGVAAGLGAVRRPRRHRPCGRRQANRLRPRPGRWTPARHAPRPRPAGVPLAAGPGVAPLLVGAPSATSARGLLFRSVHRRRHRSSSGRGSTGCRVAPRCGRGALVANGYRGRRPATTDGGKAPPDRPVADPAVERRPRSRGPDPAAPTTGGRSASGPNDGARAILIRKPELVEPVTEWGSAEGPADGLIASSLAACAGPGGRPDDGGDPRRATRRPVDDRFHVKRVGRVTTDCGAIGRADGPGAVPRADPPSAGRARCAARAGSCRAIHRRWSGRLRRRTTDASPAHRTVGAGARSVHRCGPGP